MKHTLCNMQWTAHGLQYSVCSMQCVEFTIQCSLFSVERKVYSVQPELYSTESLFCNDVHYSSVLNCYVKRGNVLYSTALYQTTMYYAVKYCKIEIKLYSPLKKLQNRTVLFCTVLNYAVLYSIEIFCTVLLRSLLQYAFLYFTSL